MKKAVLLIPVFALALSATAFAQTVDKQKGSEAVKITIGGWSDFDWIYRDRTESAIRGNGQLAGSGVGWAGVSAFTQSQTSFHNYTNIRLDVELTDKVSAVIEFGTEPFENSNFTGSSLLGNAIGAVNFRNLYVQMAEVFDPAITIRVGQIHTVFDIRGDQQSIVYDSFWTPGPTAYVGQDAVVGGQNSAVLDSAIGNTVSAGAQLTYKRDAIQLDLVLFPAVQEAFTANPAHRDVANYYLDFWYNIDSLSKGSRFGLLALLTHVPPVGAGAGPGTMFTLGGGTDLYFLDKNALEFFFEVYFQFGNVNAVSGGPDLKAQGIGLDAGLKYKFDSDLQPWLQAKVTWLSGDNNPTDNNQKAWVSQGIQRDLLVLEDPLFGMNIESNDLIFCFSGGLAFSTGGAIKNNVQLSAAIGIANADKGIVVGPTSSGSTARSEKNLGDEFDIKLKYIYTKALSLDLGLGYLFSSKVLEGLTSSTAGATTVKGNDSTFVFTMGAEIKW